MNRAHRLLLLAALTLGASAPAAAQDQQMGLSESTHFLEAVRTRNGARVQEIASNPSSTAINARDPSSGEGALHILVQRRDLGWLAYLLGRGARADLQNRDGTTALALSAQLGWLDGAEQLLLRGARVDATNNRGETPLILAVQARHLPLNQRLAMVQLLVAKGADPERQDSYAGYSALDYARQDGRSAEIVAALQDRPARPAGAVGPN